MNWLLRFLVIFALGLIFSYARWIEPNWIDITNHRMHAQIDRPLKIIQLSDLHTRGMGIREKKVLAIIESEKPDVIVITGDLVPDEGNRNGVSAFLKRIHAPLGVYVVRGNWEYWKPDQNDWRMFRDSGVTLLDNKAHQVVPNLWIIGVDDAFAGSPNVKLAFSDVPNDDFKVVLFHSPAYFDFITERMDLALAGHTHGGQVRLPLFRPFFLPHGSGSYVEGWYTKGSNKMYVNRGIGNSIFEFRFTCRPEISVFLISPQ